MVSHSYRSQYGTRVPNLDTPAPVSHFLVRLQVPESVSPTYPSSGFDSARRTRDVHATCTSRVRTNIEIEDTYVRAIMDRFGVHTKTDAVDLALRLAGTAVE